MNCYQLSKSAYMSLLKPFGATLELLSIVKAYLHVTPRTF